jgi:leucyl/phenylalanyl-tRNA---protein transferase
MGLMSAIDADELLLAYRLGMFPMAESRLSKGVLWVRPSERGIIPLDAFHVPKRLARTVRTDRYDVRTDTAFGAVIRGCAAAAPGRRDTWINQSIVDVFETLHARGFAHSVECWRDGNLAGGVYGLSLGAAFFAESKFSRATDASKVALVHLVARLKAGGYRLLDAQFPNPHLEQFGAVTVSEKKFEAMLADALAHTADFHYLGGKSPTPTSSSTGSSRSGCGAVSGGAASPPESGVGAGPTCAPGGMLSGVADTDGRCALATTGGAGGGGAGSSVMQLITQTS